MVSRQSASVIYHVSPPTVAMTLAEGAWTDDEDYKLGGYFASPLEKGQFVIQDTTAGMRVKKATASTDVPIGKLLSTPQGKHSANGRQGTVQLFGSHVMEVEIWTSSDSIAVGGSVAFQDDGGYFEEGVWAKDGTANDTIALTAYTTGSDAGTSIVVLFGKTSF